MFNVLEIVMASSDKKEANPKSSMINPCLRGNF